MGSIGKVLSEKHRRNISKSLEKRWTSGEFESIHVGENNFHYRGGTKPYSREFNDALKQFIKDRDECTCQVCGRQNLSGRQGHVHHIDGNKKNNTYENLVLLCASCHTHIHLGNSNSDALILSYRSMLK